MIIVGFRTKVGVVGVDQFNCPTCQATQRCRIHREQRWFTLYLIPIFPLGRGQLRVDCLNCGGAYSGDLLAQQKVTSNGEIVPAELVVPRSSGLATTSMILGFISLAFLPLCGLSLLTSLAAVISGHVASFKIRRSGGLLLGRGAARAGTVLGYVLLVATLFLWGVILNGTRKGWDAAERQQIAGEEFNQHDAGQALNDVEGKLISAREGVAFGNTETAKALAEEFSELLLTARQALFTADRERLLSLTDGQFLTHCELHADKCAFIVHVPSYRDFDSEAKEALAAVAWEVAQHTVRGHLAEGDQLAVGLRGTLLYGDVLVGQVALEETEASYAKGDRSSLLPFFEHQPLLEVTPELYAADEEVAEPEQTPAQRPEPEVDVEGAEVAATTQPDRRRPDPVAAPAGMAEAAESPPETGQRSGLEQPPPPTPVAVGRPRAEPGTSANVVQRFPNIGWNVTSLAFSPAANWLAVGKLDRSLALLDVGSGEQLDSHKRLADLSQVTALAFSPDGRQLYVGGYSGAIQVWNVDTNGRLARESSLTGHTREVRCLAIGADGAFVISGGADQRLMWQQTAGTRLMRMLDGFASGVAAIRLPAQGTIALASDGRTLRWVDLRSATVERELKLLGYPPHGVALSPDGSRIACCTYNSIIVWNTETGQPEQELNAGDASWSVAFVPDGRRLVSGGRSELTVWDLETSSPLARFPLESELTIQTLAISPDGYQVAAIPAAAGQTLMVFSLAEL